MKAIILSVVFATFAFAQKDPHFDENRSTIVHLFEWKWPDVAKECEDFLQHKGYGAVQISPPNENVVLQNRPWYERYQPFSYVVGTRSGDEAAFKDMTTRCNAVGVRIYIDTVINHMAAVDGTGTAGNSGFASNKSFPAVPYGYNDFHPTCDINNYNDASNVRNCELVGLKDLNQTQEYVRGKIVDYMNHLIDLGVAGFRVDAAKHMWPEDLQVIYGRTKDLNTEFGFPEGSRAFIYQEVIDLGGEAIKSTDYTGFARVLEFKHGLSIGNVFQRNDKLTYLSNWGTGWGFIPSGDAVVFVDNHDTQRSDDARILTYKKSREYKMAVAFMLSQNYGITRVMSSYAFDNHDQGPPQDADGNIISPIFDGDVSTNGYVAEHRWRQIYNMVGFRNSVSGTGINDFWSNGDQQISYCRGDKGFIAFTNGGDINQSLTTCLPPGDYCDVISGNIENGKCTGKVISVDGDTRATITLLEGDGVLALHVNAKL